MLRQSGHPKSVIRHQNATLHIATSAHLMAHEDNRFFQEGYGEGGHCVF